MKIKKSEDNKNAQLFELFKLLSSVIFIILIFLQLESLFCFLVKLIFKNIFIIVIIFLIFHYLLFHYVIESFLFLVQFPFFGKVSFNSNGRSLAKELVIYLSTFIDICEKVVDNDKGILTHEYNNLLEIYERINIMIYIFYEMKKRYGLSKYQKTFYDAAIIWRKHFNQYKVLQFFHDNKKFIGSSTNILFNKNLVILILDSNFIIKICEDFMCNDYHFLSIKRLLNYIFNDTFCSENQYKTEFSLKFKEQYNTFVTKDNKEIDYVIIDGKKITKLISERFLLEDNPLEKNDDSNSINKTEESIFSTFTNLSESNNNGESDYSNLIDDNKKRNLIIFCNPNSMIYQFFSPEKFYFYYEGGCDILFWNYRGYGQSTGFSTFDNVKKDILELYDEIKKLNKYEKIGVHGYSIGGIPAIHLAKNRNIDLLISDRNFANLKTIAEMYSFGRILKFFCKILWLDRCDKVNNYLYTKNPKCIKIILCDPFDEVVLNNGSLKSGISRYIINQKNKNENVLDNFLNTYEKNVFINSLLNIENFLEKNKASNDNLFMVYLYRFFECFSFGSEDLIDCDNYDTKRLKILYIDNFFNNFFIWGTKLSDENKENNFFYNSNNNLTHIEKAIDILKLMPTMDSNLSELNHNENILKDIKMIKNGIIRMKNNIDKIKINENLNKGYLIRLKCGHNVFIKGNDEKILVTILEKENFLL